MLSAFVRQRAGYVAIESVALAPFAVLILVLVADRLVTLGPAHRKVLESREAAWHILREPDVTDAALRADLVAREPGDLLQTEASEDDAATCAGEILGFVGAGVGGLLGLTSSAASWRVVRVEIRSSWDRFVGSLAPVEARFEAQIAVGPGKAPSPPQASSTC